MRCSPLVAGSPAASTSAEVRADIANQENLPDAGVGILARDSDVNVIENLVGRSPGRIQKEVLTSIIGRRWSRINRHWQLTQTRRERR